MSVWCFWLEACYSSVEVWTDRVFAIGIKREDAQTLAVARHLDSTDPAALAFSPRPCGTFLSADHLAAIIRAVNKKCPAETTNTLPPLSSCFDWN